MKMYLDGLCIDVNTANKTTDISIQQLHDIYRGTVTNWSAIPGSGLATTIGAVGRDTNGGTYNFFLQAVLNNEAPGANVNAADLGRPGRQRGQAGPERDRLLRPRLAGQQASSSVKVNGVPCKPSTDQEVQVPAVAVHLPRPPRPTARTRAVTKFIDWARKDPVAGEDHRQGRRGPRVQQEAAEEDQ